MGSGASTFAEVVRAITLRELPEAIEEALFVHEKYSFVVDPSQQAARFLKYQMGPFISFDTPVPVPKEQLNRGLVAAMQYGRILTLSFGNLDKFDLSHLFHEKYFPEQIIHRNKFIQEEHWKSVIHPELGDPAPEDFILSPEFSIVIVSATEYIPPTVTSNEFSFFKIKDPQNKGIDEENSSGDNPLEEIAGMFGAQEIVRNSTKLVEAGFDGDIEEIQSWLDKGFHIESVDGRKHTALSEAACQGFLNVVEYLLKLGADPNAANDTGRTPIWRAAFNGHVKVVDCLLHAGADPTVRDRVSMENVYDVAKTDEVRQLLSLWDIQMTEILKERRQKEIDERIESRIKTAAERELYAKQKIRQELVHKAEAGDADGIKEMLMMIADEAQKTKTKPRASAEVRNDQGQSLLSIAAQHDHVALASLLLTHWKVCDLDKWDVVAGEMSMEAKVFKANPNSRDLKGWTCSCIAVFHDSKNVLRLLLDHGGDPNIRSSYNKNAWDLARDEVDAAGKVVRSRAEIREVLQAHENSAHPMFSHDQTNTSCDCHGNSPNKEALDSQGTPIAMLVEFNEEQAHAAEEEHRKKTTKKMERKRSMKSGSISKLK